MTESSPTASTLNPSTVTTLSDLPIDALHSIFSYLPYPDLRAAQFVCKKFNEAVEMQYPRIFRKIVILTLNHLGENRFFVYINGTNFALTFRWSQLEAAIKKIGKYIVVLTINNKQLTNREYKYFQKFIIENCNRLEHLRIGRTFPFTTERKLKNFRRLKSVTLWDIELNAPFKPDDIICHYLNQCSTKAMESFSLLRIRKITGQCLLHENLKNLQSLTLLVGRNENFDLNALYQYLEMNKILRKLELFLKGRIVSLPRLCINIIDVEELFLDFKPGNDTFLGNVKQFSKLKELKVGRLNILTAIMPMLRLESGIQVFTICDEQLLKFPIFK